MTLLMAGVFQVILVFGCIVNMIVVDRIGRRALFIFGFNVLSLCLGIFAACSAMYLQTNGTSKYASWKKLLS